MMKFETNSTFNVFKNYYSTLADNFLKKNPTPPNKYACILTRYYNVTDILLKVRSFI